MGIKLRNSELDDMTVVEGTSRQKSWMAPAFNASSSSHGIFQLLASITDVPPEGQDDICPCNSYHPPVAIPMAMRQIITSLTHPPNSLDVVDTMISSGIRWGERRCSSDVHPRLPGVSRSREPRPCIHALAVITLHCINGPHGLSLTRPPELRPGSSLGLTGLPKAVYFERRASGCRFTDGTQVLLPTTDIAER